MAKFTHPLETIRVASPCDASWDSMAGDERIRFCSQCQKHVYNLSAMSRPEAEGLIEQTEGRLCAGFYRRKDGTILTSDCPVGLRAARRRLAMIVSAVAAVCFIALGWGMTLLGSSRGSEFGSRRLRDIEPFRTFMEWIDPTPPPMLLGAICIPRLEQDSDPNPSIEDLPENGPQPEEPPANVPQEP